MLEKLFNKQLKTSFETLESLEKKNNNEFACLTLLRSNMDSIESND